MSLILTLGPVLSTCIVSCVCVCVFVYACGMAQARFFKLFLAVSVLSGSRDGLIFSVFGYFALAAVVLRRSVARRCSRLLKRVMI